MKSNNPANAQLQHTFKTHIENTHRHPYDIEHVQEKLLLYSIKMANACIYNGVLELSLALLNSYNHYNLNSPSQNGI
jgi:ferritin-like metal-binding protein YciE